MNDGEPKVQALDECIRSSYANHSYLYRWLEKDAPLQAIANFLRWDAEQPPFYEYLQRWVHKAPSQVRSALEDHIAVELREQHSHLFAELLKALPATSEFVDPKVLASLNYTFSELCAREQSFGFFLGGFYATEIMSGKRCRQLYEGLRRHGVSGECLRYLELHFEADERHAAEVRELFIFPILKQTPDLLPSIWSGALDRLTRSGNYLRWCEERFLG